MDQLACLEKKEENLVTYPIQSNYLLRWLSEVPVLVVFFIEISRLLII